MFAIKLTLPVTALALNVAKAFAVTALRVNADEPVTVKGVMSFATKLATLFADVPDVIVTVSSLSIVKLVAIAEPVKATVRESAAVSTSRE